MNADVVGDKGDGTGRGAGGGAGTGREPALGALVASTSPTDAADDGPSPGGSGSCGPFVRLGDLLLIRAGLSVCDLSGLEELLRGEVGMQGRRGEKSRGEG